MPLIGQMSRTRCSIPQCSSRGFLHVRVASSLSNVCWQAASRCVCPRCRARVTRSEPASVSCLPPTSRHHPPRNGPTATLSRSCDSSLASMPPCGVRASGLLGTPGYGRRRHRQTSKPSFTRANSGPRWPAFGADAISTYLDAPSRFRGRSVSLLDSLLLRHRESSTGSPVSTLRTAVIGASASGEGTLLERLHNAPSVSWVYRSSGIRERAAAGCCCAIREPIGIAGARGHCDQRQRNRHERATDEHETGRRAQGLVSTTQAAAAVIFTRGGSGQRAMCQHMAR